jgi:integrase
VLKMANRTSYTDHDLVFAKEAADQQTPTAQLGDPCVALTKRYFAAVVKAAGVRAITPHGLRHTTATLLLGAGMPVQVVAQRLGHADVTMTLNTYAHALPDAQRDAASTLNAVLAG